MIKSISWELENMPKIYDMVKILRSIITVHTYTCGALKDTSEKYFTAY